MLPRAFQYFAPSSLEEAIGLLREHPGEAKVLAGGMSLVPLMKLRLASPGCVVDINRVEGLRYIEESADGRALLIGALTRHHELETSPLIRKDAPLLSETAGLIGDAQVRNQGTIGGTLAHCDPSGDLGAAMLALRGAVDVKGPSGERRIAIDELLLDTFTTSLKEDEIITRVSIPLAEGGRRGGAYLKLERKAGDYATVGVAAQLGLEAGGEGAIAYAGIGLTALGPKNLRASEAEKSLVGRRPTAEAIAGAAAAAARECTPTDDLLRGSASYKREMAGVFTRRALELAVRRARGEDGRGSR